MTGNFDSRPVHEFVLGGLSVISYVILYTSTIIVSHTMHTHACSSNFTEVPWL